MNPGILTSGYRPPPMPYASFGRQRPFLMPNDYALHPEALDWVTRLARLRVNVSTDTALAVSRFCTEIDNAGIRSRFLRLNLFCGGSLAACLTPLYRGPTPLQAPFFGFTSDVNGNFVSGDYTERGQGGGLVGNGATKFLETGIRYSDLVSRFPSNHLAAYFNNQPTAGNFLLQDASNEPYSLITNWNLPTEARSMIGFASSLATSDPLASRAGMRILSVLNGSQQFVVRSGASTITQTASASVGSWSSFPNAEMNLYRRQIQNNTHDSYSNARCCGYSVGLGLTTSQAGAYLDAMETFQAALGRQR